jgi:phospholipid-binding lipoprotein MlaA
MAVCAALAVFSVSACTTPGPDFPASEVFDPYEEANRNTHALNKAVDKAVLRPVAKAYVAVLPEEAVISVGNFADNLGEPANAVNHLLQGDLRGVTRNVTRFVVNSTLGFGGLFDAAADLGVYPDESDFGETLHVWGAPEGAYVELPLFGPSNERDTVGRVVDMLTDPLDTVMTVHQKNAARTTKVLKRVGDRGRYADTLDSLLYDSADSYAQGRLLGTQNRRHELGIQTEDAYIAPEDIDTEGF